jgi:Protein of unknown function (DUF1501)
MMQRRPFLQSSFATLALFDLVKRESLAAASTGVVNQLHHSAKVKRVVQLFMAGAASHVDMFDHKPLLTKLDGQPWDPGESVELFQSTPGACFGSPWSFKPITLSARRASTARVLCCKPPVFKQQVSLVLVPGSAMRWGAKPITYQRSLSCQIIEDLRPTVRRIGRMRFYLLKIKVR